MARIVPTVRIKKDSKRKNPWLVYYRRLGKVVHCGYYPSKSGKGGAEEARKAEQSRLHAAYGNASAPSMGGNRIGARIDDFIAYHRRKGSAPDTIKCYTDRLGYLKRKIGDMTFDSLILRKSDLRVAIQAAGNGQVWEKNILRTFGAFMNWGARQEPPICPPSIARFVDLEHRIEPRHRNFFTVEESRMFMEAAKGDWRRFPMALRFYAGLRMRELERLQWEHIDRASRTVYIPPDVGRKTAGHMEELPEILWRWLEDGPTSGRVSIGRNEDIIKNMRRYLPIPKEAQGATTRRTFATYAANLYGVERARKWMRHGMQLSTLETHYLGCVTTREGKPYIATKAASEAYFAL